MIIAVAREAASNGQQQLPVMTKTGDRVQRAISLKEITERLACIHCMSNMMLLRSMRCIIMTRDILIYFSIGIFCYYVDVHWLIAWDIYATMGGPGGAGDAHRAV